MKSQSTTLFQMIRSKVFISDCGRLFDTIAIYFGDWIKTVLPINLLFLLLFVQLLYELMQMPNESETRNYYTRSQISIVREAESLIMQDLSRI